MKKLYQVEVTEWKDDVHFVETVLVTDMYGDFSYKLINGKRPVKQSVKKDKLGNYILVKKVKYYI